MQQPISPFSKAQLLPKEERLEVSNHNAKLNIGLPKNDHFKKNGFA
jgi:alanine dehydrogenase